MPKIAHFNSVMLGDKHCIHAKPVSTSLLFMLVSVWLVHSNVMMAMTCSSSTRSEISDVIVV